MEATATDAAGSQSLSSPASFELPTWDDLESIVEESKNNGAPEQKPVLTLYRDTNGWCPFCERVWVAVRAKGLPYQETLVPLQGKPEWYKQMVPTGLVPAVLFHGDQAENEEETDTPSTPNTRRELVWESDAILRALDAKFPDTVRLMRDDDEDFNEALKLQDRVQAAGFKMAYANRNGTLTDAEIEEHRSAFGGVLDELDSALATVQEQQTGDGACFRLGPDFSGLDAIMVPTLERWRHQLPLTENFDILEGRPHLEAWFDHMEAFPAFGARIAGDEYSWTATASMFLRYFGGGEDKPKVAAGIARADAAAEELAEGFSTAHASASSTTTTTTSALEAANKLVSNHAAVLKDCLGGSEPPKSQGHIPRAGASAEETVDALLRHVVVRLLQHKAVEENGATSATETLPTSMPMPRDLVMENDDAIQGALALRTVAKRLCVPRDMGAPSAALLRGILCTVADDLED